MLLALTPVLAFAQVKVHLDFGSPGEREIWIAEGNIVPASTMPVKEATLDLPLPAGEMKSRLYIWDRKTGNLASKVLNELKATWKLAPEDFSLIGKVTVRVEHDEEPVKLAFVKLKDASGERESTINESRKGEATFFGVKPGTVSVTVNYMSKGQDAEPVKLSRDLALKRDEADPEMVVSLTGEVETTNANAEKGEKSEKSEKSEKPKEPQGGNVIGSIIVYLLGLGAAAAAVYFLMRYMKTNQDKVSDQLKKLGVEIPDPNDPAQADPGPAPVPVPPAPPQKIILDDADPGVPPSSSSVAPAAPVSVSSPSLVMENGDVFPLPDGETTVGREASNGLSLVAESTVSRSHAVLIRNGNDVMVRDLGSSNGTFVNGVKVAGDMNLRPGDQVQFGQARFRYEA